MEFDVALQDLTPIPCNPTATLFLAKSLMVALLHLDLESKFQNRQGRQKARPRIFPQSVQFLKRMKALNRPVGMMLARLRAMTVVRFKTVQARGSDKCSRPFFRFNKTER